MGIALENLQEIYRNLDQFQHKHVNIFDFVLEGITAIANLLNGIPVGTFEFATHIEEEDFCIPDHDRDGTHGIMIQVAGKTIQRQILILDEGGDEINRTPMNRFDMLNLIVIKPTAMFQHNLSYVYDCRAMIVYIVNHASAINDKSAQ